MADIRRLALPLLPPLITQRRIASILSAYDDLIENNERRIAILEDMARRIFREWFVEFRFPGHEAVPMVDTEAGKIPEGWRVAALREVLDLKYGKALKADAREAGPFPVFGSSGVVGTHSSAMVEGPGIVVGRKGNVGAVHWSQAAFWPIDTAFFVHSDLPLHWVHQQLLSLTFLNSDAAVPGLNREGALNMKINYPPEELIERFAPVATAFRDQSSLLSAATERLRASRDLLLPRLISGELSVEAAEHVMEAAE